MSLHWINITPKLQEGVSLINSINPNKFTLLLQHIIESENEEIFTPSEFTKLSESLKLEIPQVQLLVQSISHILKQSLKVIVKPTILQKQLVENLQLTEDKAEKFVKRWTQETKRDFDVENSKNLEDLKWELNLETACNHLNKEQHINTRLQLNLIDINKQNKENVTLELDENQLTNLYLTLEKIQNKLDSF